MNGRLEEAERDGLVGEENANEKEKGKYKIHKYKIHMVKIQTTRCKIKNHRMWRRREGRGEKGGRGDMRQLRYITKYCGSADEYYAEGGEGKCGEGREMVMNK